MIRVLLVDDDALVRSGLRMMLAGAESLEVVGKAADGREVLGAIDLHRPDVVLMDIRMPQLDGIAATRLLAAQPHPPTVLVLTTFDADELVLRALQAGAAGFLLKDTPPPGRDRSRDRARSRRRRHALPGSHPTAHLDGGRRLRRRPPRRACPRATGDAEPARARRRHGRRPRPRQRRDRRETAPLRRDGQGHVSRLLDKLEVDNRVQIALLVQEADGR